ncbi:hypothetical protein L596_000744 [Steinernema carpocapsae]|nr:hypothetical protein L596_000744 [Steinernema carpocapsae]
MGIPIPNTPFLAFKTPLTAAYTAGCPHEQFDLEDLFKEHKSIGLIIDLTWKYYFYDAKRVRKEFGKEHAKIPCHGHEEADHSKNYPNFRDTVKDFLKHGRDHLVGVHCTHGLNRTGYMVCRYLIEELGWDAHHAIETFEETRGHSIERENYKSALIQKHEVLNARRRDIQD